MPWSASIVYAQGTPRLRAALLGDPILGPALCHIRDLSAETGSPEERELPRGGLLAVPDVGPPEHPLPPAIPWDALRGPADARIAFPDPARVRESTLLLAPWDWPPPAALRLLKHLSREAGGPISLYRCEVERGERSLQAAWVPGWAPGEPDRVLALADGGGLVEAVGGRVRVRPGGVLGAMLELHRLRLQSGRFVPHARGLGAASPVPGDRARRGRPRRPTAGVPGLAVPLRAAGRPRRGGAARRRRRPERLRRDPPIEVAAGLGRADLVALLLRHGAEVRWALHAAPTVEIARLLLAAGADPAAEGPWYTPLAVAARRGDDAVARALVAHGAPLRPQGLPDSVWLAACEGGLAWLVDELLARGADVPAQGHVATQTPLALACAGGHAAAAERLLAAGAAPDEVSLLAACRGGSGPLVLLHLARGVSPEARQHGVPALQLALAAGHVGVARQRLAAGASRRARGLPATPRCTSRRGSGRWMS